jgi:transposase
VTQIICGEDVSSDTLDASIGRDGPTLQVPRTAEGIAALADFCRDHGAGFVAMEATGGYERLPFHLLWADGIPAALLNARSVRRFGEAMGCFEKTDRLDASLIAWYAQTKRIVPQPPPSLEQQRLQALVTRRRQVVHLRTTQLNQGRLVDDPDVLASIREFIATANRQIRAFEAEITRLIGHDPLWRALDQAIREIKGVAERTSAGLLAELPELGTLSNKAIAKLVGLAPIARDSGKTSGRRPIRGGRSPVRSLLFLVAEIARRHNPQLLAFHQKLRDAGKPKMVARIALARKLLVWLNAKARDARQQLALAA